MKILNVHHSVNPAQGGTLEATRQIGTILRAMGHEVEWASMDPPDAAWVRDFSLPLHTLGDRSADGYGRAPRFIPWLREHRRNYDAVVVHGLWQYPGFATRRALHGSDTPYFVMPHGMLDPWFKQAYPLKHFKKSIYWLLAEHAVLRDARAVIFTCEEERLLAQGTFWPYRIREKVAPLGTSVPEGEPAAWREAFYQRYPGLRGRRMLLFLSRLHPKKGCDLLIRAFAKAGGPLSLVIVGPEEDVNHARELRMQTEGLSVFFVGMLSGELKWGALAAAEVFALPSHQENFGMAVVESLAVGTPVLISNKVNIWREIETDGAGFVEPDHTAGTTRLLQRWLEADHESMRAAARGCFAARFDIRKTAENMLSVLQS
ncbi:MAG: glycosyltransferase [Verrucomicrobiota bacterium]